MSNTNRLSKVQKLIEAYRTKVFLRTLVLVLTRSTQSLLRNIFPRWLINTTIEKLFRLSAPRWFYLLSPVVVNQMQTARADAMKDLVAKNFSSPISALEVGTWYGEGSTKLWLAALPCMSKLVLLDSWRPYLSDKDKGAADVSYRSMDDLSFSAMHNVLKIVREHEKDSLHLDVSVIRGGSQSVLNLLKESNFDFIYIDGSHYYADVVEDIASAKRLLKRDFSIICGDDLELAIDDELVTLARNNLDRDFISCSKGSFHPGVLLAIHEQLGEVNMQNGFWWKYVVKGDLSLHSSS
jgi:hypothetical protein